MVVVAFGTVPLVAVVGVARPGAVVAVVVGVDRPDAPVLDFVPGAAGVVERPVLGVLVPGVAGVVVVGSVAVGTVAVGVVAGVVTVIVLGAVVVECAVEPASLMSAAASTPIASAMTIASAITGVFHAGDAARRVRAAAPQRRHHSCSGASEAPHNGHA